MSPGYKTTEFWVTIGVQIVGFLTLLGILTPDQAEAWVQIVIQVAGLVAMILAQLGYAISRGKAKSADVIVTEVTNE